MKPLILLALLCHSTQRALSSEEDIDLEWQAWKRSFGVSYVEKSDEGQRKAIWEDNMKLIEEHNQNYLKGDKKFKLAMNKYGDLTKEEYKILQGTNIYNKPRKVGKKDSALKLRVAAKRLNAVRVDYRTMGYVTRVKDQGFCGSCWAFSTTGAIEGQLFKRTGQLVSLSEQNLLDCSRSYGTYGCNGAWMANAYDYVVKHGLQSEATYPYTSLDNQPCSYDKRKSVVKIKDYKFIPAGDEQALADAVATIGPITVAVDADNPSFMFYNSGIYEEPNCDANNLSHAVLLVGYGSEGGKDYWIIKNSWGTGWGENGYMRMIRNNNNACGISSYALYPVL
ncbi:digestive cysteine proteinase 2 [Lepisosteus oculatus]|uniref:digestive cysteine proteinase 2 n=1 Tax=Lepisosteus oculatus TaxID=7918 RepID=UPI00372347C0